MSEQSGGMESENGLAEAIAVAFEAMVKALVALLMFLLLLVLLQALRMLFTIAPALARLAAIGAAIAAAVVTWPKVYAAYGSSPVAVLPAACVVLAPVAFGLAVGAQSSLWGALVFAALATWCTGFVIPALPDVVRGLVVVGVVGAIALHFLTQTQEVKEDESQIG